METQAATEEWKALREQKPTKRPHCLVKIARMKYFGNDMLACLSFVLTSSGEVMLWKSSCLISLFERLRPCRANMRNMSSTLQQKH